MSLPSASFDFAFGPPAQPRATMTDAHPKPKATRYLMNLPIFAGEKKKSVEPTHKSDVPPSAATVCNPSVHEPLADSLSYMLPAELWLKIFGMISTCSNIKQDLATLITVCRFWKDLVEEALFHDITVASSFRLDALRNRVIHSGGLNGCGVGRYIRALEMSERLEPSGQHIVKMNPASPRYESIVLVLLSAPRLEAFVCRRMMVQPRLLACIQQSCTATLTSLHIGFDDEQTHAVVALLGSFTALRDLGLYFVARTVLEQDMELCLPSVRSFTLDWLTCFGEDHSHGVYHLASVRFHPECAMVIRMPELSSGDARRMLPFFRAYTPRALTLVCPSEAAVLLAPELRAVPELHFPRGVPPPEFFGPQPLPRELHITASSSVCEKLWAFLRSLEDRPQGTAHRTHLHISFRDKMRLSWAVNTCQKQMLFKGAILVTVINLERRGITVVDQHGLDIGSMMGFTRTSSE